jgi:hypothetical protein
MKKILILTTLLFFGTSGLFAQLIDVTPEVTTLCTGGSATLTATVNPPGSGGVPGSLPTTSYAISSIPFSPAPITGGISTSMTDDSQTGVLPFAFSEHLIPISILVPMVGSLFHHSQPHLPLLQFHQRQPGFLKTVSWGRGRIGNQMPAQVPVARISIIKHWELLPTGSLL